MTEAEPMDTRSNGEIAQSILNYAAAIEAADAERTAIHEKINTLCAQRDTEANKLKVRIGTDLIRVGDKIMKINRYGKGLEEVKIHA